MFEHTTLRIKLMCMFGRMSAYSTFRAHHLVLESSEIPVWKEHWVSAP
jgi:hypothetical protein